MAEPVHPAGGNPVVRRIFNDTWMLRLTYLFLLVVPLLFFVVLDLPSGTVE